MKNLLFVIVASVMMTGLLVGSIDSNVYATKDDNNGKSKGCDNANEKSKGIENNPHCSKSSCEEPIAWYVDSDGDGWGSLAMPPTVSCTEPEEGQWTDIPGDCNDFDGTINPGAGNC